MGVRLLSDSTVNAAGRNHINSTLR